MSVTLLNSLGALNKLISTVRTSGARFSANVHQAAYNCLAHIENTGDIRPLQKLYDALPVGSTQRALRVWATKFGKVSFTDKNGFKFSAKGSTDLDGAASVGVLEYTKPRTTERKAFDLRAEIDRLIKKAGTNNITGKSVDHLRKAFAAA